MPKVLIALHGSEDFETIHIGEHPVQKNQCRRLRRQGGQSRPSIAEYPARKTSLCHGQGNERGDLVVTTRSPRSFPCPWQRLVLRAGYSAMLGRLWPPCRRRRLH